MKDIMKELESWINKRPPHVQRVIRKHPPTTCYKGKKRGHYIIYSYDEYTDGAIKVKVHHLGDSFLPGFSVFGVRLSDLVPCGCIIKKPLDNPN